MKENVSKLTFWIYSLVIGFINGIFGSGGGILAIKFLEKLNIKGKKAHATAILVILPITIVSVAFYFMKGHMPFMEALPYIAGGFVGAWLGSKFLCKIDNFYLKKIFAVFVLYSAVRMFMK